MLCICQSQKVTRKVLQEIEGPEIVRLLEDVRGVAGNVKECSRDNERGNLGGDAANIEAGAS